MNKNMNNFFNYGINPQAFKNYLCENHGNYLINLNFTNVVKIRFPDEIKDINKIKFIIFTDCKIYLYDKNSRSLSNFIFSYDGDGLKPVILSNYLKIIFCMAEGKVVKLYEVSTEDLNVKLLRKHYFDTQNIQIFNLDIISCNNPHLAIRKNKIISFYCLNNQINQKDLNVNLQICEDNEVPNIFLENFKNIRESFEIMDVKKIYYVQYDFDLVLVQINNIIGIFSHQKQFKRYDEKCYNLVDYLELNELKMIVGIKVGYIPYIECSLNVFWTYTTDKECYLSSYKLTLFKYNEESLESTNYKISDENEKKENIDEPIVQNYSCNCKNQVQYKSITVSKINVVDIKVNKKNINISFRTDEKIDDSDANVSDHTKSTNFSDNISKNLVNINPKRDRIGIDVIQEKNALQVEMIHYVVSKYKMIIKIKNNNDHIELLLKAGYFNNVKNINYKPLEDKTDVMFFYYENP